MGVLQTTTAVTLTQSVAILSAHTIVPANLDLLEMEENVSVTYNNYRYFNIIGIVYSVHDHLKQI